MKCRRALCEEKHNPRREAMNYSLQFYIIAPFEGATWVLSFWLRTVMFFGKDNIKLAKRAIFCNF